MEIAGMAEHSAIEWTDATWNPITGCSVVSPGCTNCYAMRLAGTRLRNHPSRAGLTTLPSRKASTSKSGPVWNGEVRLNEQWLDQPLRWRKPRRIFVCAHGDLFHESVQDEWIDQVFAVMALAPQHTFQVLTKRPERMRAYITEQWQPAPAHRIEYLGLTAIDVPAEMQGETREDQVRRACEPILETMGLVDTANDALWTADGDCKAMQWKWPLPNVWLGVSVEDQRRADERIPLLLATPAAVRFLSVEPMLMVRQWPHGVR
jgi:protein gp37